MPSSGERSNAFWVKVTGLLCQRERRRPVGRADKLVLVKLPALLTFPESEGGAGSHVVMAEYKEPQILEPCQQLSRLGDRSL